MEGKKAMKNKTKVPILVYLFIFGTVVVISAISLFSLSYTKNQLELARSKGIYPNPETGMKTLINQDYIGIQKVEIIYAGPNYDNGSKPFVWFVVADIWAKSRFDGSSLGYGKWDHDSGGSYFLQTKEGWVHVTEHLHPEFVAFLMEVYGLAGEGNPRASHPRAE
jgi:hypothetical protein